jgi:hypothetical protein
MTECQCKHTVSFTPENYVPGPLKQHAELEDGAHVHSHNAPMAGTG